MRQSRDIFTMAALGRELTLADLVIALPAPVAKAMLGKAPSSLEEAAAITDALGGVKQQVLWETTQLVHQAARLDSDDLEDMVRKKGFKPPAKDTRYGLAYLLISKLGLSQAQEVISAALAPEALDNSGTFSHYGSPRLPSTLNHLDISGQIEAALEKELSTPKKKRLVKVRAEMVSDRLIVAVYYQRRETDGRKISTDKKLSTEAFARSAGCTYFTVTKHPRASRVMFRSPGSPLVARLRPLIGQAIWGKAHAIDTKPHSEYDLAKFKNPTFTLSVAPDLAKSITSVRLSEIDVKAATGNFLRVKAPGIHGDAFSDFHSISSNAQVLIRHSAVQAITLKFGLTSDKRRRPKVRVTPTTLTLDEHYLATVEAHLKHWGVMT